MKTNKKFFLQKKFEIFDANNFWYLENIIDVRQMCKIIKYFSIYLELECLMGDI